MLESSLKAGPSVYSAVVNDGSAQKAVRDVATLISMTVGIPVNLAARPIGYMAGMADNKIVPTSEADMARGLVTGIASPESKR
jgi:lipid-binding SYLF domain-containing protein